MKNTVIYAFLAVVFVVSTLTGCKKDGRPDDLPPLFPCVITIVQEGTPLAEAAVKFVPVEGTDAKFTASGITNEQGKVTMKTYGFEGSPVGKYKVSVRKLVVEEGPKTTNEDGEEVATSRNEYQAVEKEYMDAKTTPHEIEITASKETLEKTFDVGKALTK